MNCIDYNYNFYINVQSSRTHCSRSSPDCLHLGKYRQEIHRWLFVLSQYFFKNIQLNVIVCRLPSLSRSSMTCQSRQSWTSPCSLTLSSLPMSCKSSSRVLSPPAGTSSRPSRTSQETSPSSSYSSSSSLASSRAAPSLATASAMPLCRAWSTTASMSLSTERSTTPRRSWRLVLLSRSSRSSRLSSPRKSS